MKFTKIALAVALLFTATTASMASSRAGSGQASPSDGIESQR